MNVTHHSSLFLPFLRLVPRRGSWIATFIPGEGGPDSQEWIRHSQTSSQELSAEIHIVSLAL